MKKTLYSLAAASLILGCATSDPHGSQGSLYNAVPQPDGTIAFELKPEVRQSINDAKGWIPSPWGEVGATLALGALGIVQTIRNSRNRKLAKNITRSVNTGLDALPDEARDTMVEHMKGFQEASGDRAEVQKLLQNP